MKLLAIELVGVGLASVLADERLENIRRLVDAGTFGGLTGDEAEFGPLLDGASERRRLTNEGGAAHVDRELGEVLGEVDRDTVLLVIASGGAEEGSWYVLAAPGIVPAGETGTVDAPHLAGVVSDLLERDAEAPDEDDEALLRERFSGLGYIS